MRKKIDKILESILVLCIIGLIFEGIYIHTNLTKEKEYLLESQPSFSEEPPEKPEEEKKEPLTLPESFELDIPFITQAPFRSWQEYPFNHTCEEAAVLMVHYYLVGIKEVDENQTRKELLDLVDFQTENYGFHEDTSAAQTAKLIEDYYGYQAKVYYDISLEEIKKEIIKGNPVIVPTAGRLLENPNYTPPGPLFHMLVIKGYNQFEFITQDSGTYRTGQNRHYSYEIIEKAIHDWNNGDVLNGRKAMIVVSQP